MKKILVAINYSEQSLVVLKYAMKLAQYFGAELGVVYVLQEGEVKKIEGRYVQNLKEEHLRIAIEKLNLFVTRQYGKQYHSIPLDTYSRIGVASEEIADLAYCINADFIIVGKQYHSKFSIFDGTADALISISPCPVLIIPENGEFHSLKRIIYASDFLLEDCAAIFQLQEWITIFKGELICIHVSRDKKQLEIAKRKMAILTKLFPQENISFRCFIADVDKALKRYASITKADLLCTMHKNRNMFQSLFQSSVSKELSDYSKRPMAIFHQHMMTSKTK